MERGWVLSAKSVSLLSFSIEHRFHPHFRFQLSFLYICFIAVQLALFACMTHVEVFTVRGGEGDKGGYVCWRGKIDLESCLNMK